MPSLSYCRWIVNAKTQVHVWITKHFCCGWFILTLSSIRAIYLVAIDPYACNYKYLA